jgi:hypothetical protein
LQKGPRIKVSVDSSIGTGTLTGNSMWQQDAHRMIQRRARARPVFRKPSEEFRAPAWEICGAPYKLRQALNLPTPEG